MTHHPHEDGYFGDVDHGKDYEGSLIDDCDSIVELGERLRASMKQVPGPSIFDVARARRANKSVDELMSEHIGERK
jgi:hypothetical protein